MGSPGLTYSAELTAHARPDRLASAWLNALMLLVALLAAPKVAGAQDRITQRAVYEDITATRTFQQIVPETFTAFSGILSQGYRHSAFWIRLHLEPRPEQADAPLILRIRPGYLDEIRLYDPQYNALGRDVTGDSQPMERDHYRSLNSTLVIPEGNQPRDIWLRVVSTSSLLFEVQALSVDEALQQDRVQEIGYGLFLTALGLLSLWGAMHWLIRPDRLLLLFTLKQTAGLVYMAGYLGYARVLWPAGLTAVNAGQYTDWTFPLYPALGCLFDYHLLRSCQAHPLGVRVLLGLAGYTPIYYALMLSHQPQLAFQGNAVLVLVGICLTPLLALSIPRQESRHSVRATPLSRRGIILYYMIIVAGFMPSVLPLLGLAKASFLVFDGFLVYSLVSGLAMLGVMIRQARDYERHLIAAEAARDCAERRAELEQQQREEQAQFITMLTHELKTPLAVVRMVLGIKAPTDQMKGEAERSIRDMNNVIQRCMQLDKLSEPAKASHRRPCSLVDELSDIIESATESDRNRIRFAGGEFPPLETDPLLLRLIIANLLDNACKYSPDASPVTLSLIPKGRHGRRGQCIRVANLPDAAGWPEPEKLFHKFYRHPRAHHFTGSGLGLFLSARLAEQLGGELHYQPTPSEIGFELWLPL